LSQLPENRTFLKNPKFSKIENLDAFLEASACRHGQLLSRINLLVGPHPKNI
jgi:hypothetical protein